MVSSGLRGPGRNSSPIVWATGIIAACITSSYGMPSRSAASRSCGRCNVVQQVPNPRARAASMKLQTAGRIDPHCEAWTAALGSVRSSGDAGDHQHGDFSHVVGKVLRRAISAQHIPARAAKPGFRRDPSRDRLQVRVPTLLVERSEGPPLVRIRHDDERPALLIAAAGGLLGQVKALLDQRRVDRAREIEPSPDGACGREQFVRAEVEFGTEVAGSPTRSTREIHRVVPAVAAAWLRLVRGGMGSARRREQCQYHRDRTVPALLGEWLTAMSPNGKSSPNGETRFADRAAPAVATVPASAWAPRSR